MNKQQLAAKIWESANKLRSKIEANEYKDYILGFIFYKFLSDKEEQMLRKDGWGDEDLKELTEDEKDTVASCRDSLGYFISYDNLFSTWLKLGKDFDVSNVTDALSAFNRLIAPRHKKVFDKIFNTLETGLSKLGDTSGARTKAISNLLQLIKDIPMDGKEDYDVLGFIYEYLISNFAANAGKKAGEFYTPHEVSLLMSEIIADHLKDRDRIEIYDPTSGSGSLLINIGRVAARHMGNRDNIKYYAQELKENTYNLTRMNLVMRGIIPDNIVTRNGDTLEEDWPFFDEDHVYSPLYVDAVVSNPPYSQHWDPSEDKQHDPRYADYGMAPKTKADYAFLLHDLYHLKPDGIMTIVLPHGVLFRGDATAGADGMGENEGRIRRNLIEKNRIEAIIGLPANIFFGTGIPTIIMVLRKDRSDTDVLIVDASKHFEKVGKNNRLRASDIKRIVDAVVGRLDIPKFSRKVSRQEIRDNNYNLNIPRYVDSSEPTESWDILATMCGGIPNAEIDGLKPYWDAFPTLRVALFHSDETPYSSMAVEDIGKAIRENADVVAFRRQFGDAFGDFPAYLKEKLIDGLRSAEVKADMEEISSNIFGRLAPIPLVDKYAAYQILDGAWSVIGVDLETIRREGFASTKAVDPNMVIKKKNGEDQEVQEGWVGRIIPFDLVQRTLLKEEADAVTAKENRLTEIEGEYEEIIDDLSEEEKEGNYLNDDNTAFVPAGLKAKVKEIYDDVDSDELRALMGYIALWDQRASKGDKLRYIDEHTEADWGAIEGSGVYAKGKVQARIKALKQAYSFPEASFETKMIRAEALMEEEKTVKKEAKELAAALHLHTKEVIEDLEDDQVLEFLELKWIAPLADNLNGMPGAIIDTLTKKVEELSKKYATTLKDIDAEIDETEKVFRSMLGDLTGNEYDMRGLAELKSLLGGDEDA